MIKSLNFLRFLFAVLIFLHHENFMKNEFFEAFGLCGVSFFIILSGFVMSAGYMKKIFGEKFNYKNYLVKRFLRLYPLHFLCLLGFIVINISGGDKYIV